jgi:hypothetical protein
VIACQEWPLRASRAGLYLLDPRRRQPPPFIEAADLFLVPWEELADVTLEGRSLKAGERTLLITPSPGAARLFADRLRALAAAPAEHRLAELERLLAEATDLDGLRDLRRATGDLGRWLKTGSALLFAGLYLGVPLHLYTDARHLTVQPLLVVLGVLHVAVVALSAMTLRRTGAGARSFLAALPHLLLPTSAAHALVHLLRDAHHRYDPRALAAALMDRGAFTAFARRELARLAQARAGTASLGLERHWDIEERTWARLLERLGISPAEVARPPPRAETGSSCYCPLCEGEYRDGFARCGDCGAPLRPFSA